MLTVKDLTMIYARRGLGIKGPGHRALDEVSFEVRRGEVFGLLGPNGAGKTTLFKILASLIIPSSGSILIQGRNLSPRARSRVIGLSTGEERSFYYRLTGWQNLSFFGSLRFLKGARLRERIDACLEAVGLGSEQRIQFMKYSTGMRKRLNIARALLHNPDILLLDEPTASLDPVSAQRVHRLIADLKAAGGTVILATHNLHEAEAVCDRIGVLSRGKLLMVASPEDLGRLESHRRVRLQTAVALRESHQRQLRLLPGVTGLKARNSQVDLETTDLPATLDSIVQWAAGERCRLRNIKVLEPTLEDVFFRLVAAQDNPVPHHTAEAEV